MKKNEIIDIKKLPKIKFKRKVTLNNTQKIIIFLITLFFLFFICYKVEFSIYIAKENIKIPNFSKYFSVINSENLTNNFNLQENIINKTQISYEALLIQNSYSIYLEDLILNSFFYNENKGFYIDLGEFGPEKTSTTKYFYLKGWNGMNIKPLNEQYKEIIKSRPNDININYHIEDNILKKYIFQDYNNINKTFNKLSDVFNKYIPKNKKIHFFKINLKDDVRKILLGYDFWNFRPNIFCIENNNNGTYNYESYEYILIKNDYSFIYQYELDRYYIDKRCKGLEERVDFIDGLIQFYKSKKNNINEES